MGDTTGKADKAHTGASLYKTFALCDLAFVLQLYLQSMRLSVAAGGHPWLVMNAALAAWNTYLPLMQRERYADLADILLPVLQQLLQVCCKCCAARRGRVWLPGTLGDADTLSVSVCCTHPCTTLVIHPRMLCVTRFESCLSVISYSRLPVLLSQTMSQSYCQVACQPLAFPLIHSP